MRRGDGARPLPQGRVFRWTAALILMLGIAQQASVAGGAAPAPEARTNAPLAAFHTEQTVVRLGGPAAVPFRLADAAETDQTVAATVSDPALLAVTRPAVVRAGQVIGHVLLEPLATGETDLVLANGATLRVSIEPAVTEPAARLLIEGPTEGSALWGSVIVAVRCAPELAKMTRLMLPSGELLEPQENLTRHSALWSQLLFEVDADALDAGVVAMQAVAEHPDGRRERSEPRHLRIMRPSNENLLAGECEEHLHDERPEIFGTAPPHVGSHGGASGGSFVVNNARDPEWCLTLELRTAGWYQMIVRARGDEAAGALPSVGLCIGNSDTPVTGARLLTSDWHRVPVGRPVWLEAGKTSLAVVFTNDFYVPNMADRNLNLDAFELLRLDAQQPEAMFASAAGGSMMGGGGAMMAGGAMTMGNGSAMTAMAPAGTMGGGMAGGMAGGMGGGMAGGASGGMGGTTAGPAPAEGSMASGLIVAFDRPFDGQPVTGRLEVKGYCAWNDPRNTPAPTVTLLVNGAPVASQVAAQPLFWLDRAALRTGINGIQLVASLPDGTRAASPLQTVRVPGEIDFNDRPRRAARFTALDPRWGDTLAGRLNDRDRPQGFKTACFSTNGRATLELPDELTGSFEMMLHARADEFQGPPIARLTLEVPDAEPIVSEQKIWGWWNLRDFGRVDLPPGPKRVHVEFINDAYEEGKGDRNLWVWGVQFYERDDRLDRIAPQIKLLYPKQGALGHGADVVVAEGFDDTRPAFVDLMIDGKPQRINERPGEGVGRYVLPLLLRDLEPGVHQISVRIEDEAGNVGMSETVRYHVLAEPPSKSGPYARAVHLLSRFGYGAEPAELADVLTMGEAAYLKDRLGRDFATPGERIALGNATAHFRDDYNYAITQRVTQQMLLTDNPVRMRFVLWAQNHFSTWIGKTEGAAKWQEHLRFAELGPAPFEALLRASATSPAMLIYLDQTGSYRGRLNENYARELMELHTLGADAGYSQADVTAMARLLTGWTTVQQADLLGDATTQNRRGYTFSYAPALADPGKLAVFTLPLPQARSAADRYARASQMLAVLASHPKTAQFISRKLTEHYVATPAPDALVDDLAEVFLATGGDMREVLLALAGHEAFMAAAKQPRVATPMDYAVRLCRVTGQPNNWAVRQCAYGSGAGLFDRSTPDGYPEEDAQYSTTNSLMQRWRFARSIEWPLFSVVPEPWRQPPADADDTWRQRVVDVAALRLTGRLLSPRSNQAALDLLENSEFTDHRRILLLTTTLAQLPEANLR